MTDILKRQYAPITEQAWSELDEQAKESIVRVLTARKVVDFNGPFGWDFAAVNLGRVELASTKGDIQWGSRIVAPLIEVRVPFTLDLMELDNVSRGSKDAELQPLVDACEKIAQFEDNAVFDGFSKGGIDGIRKSSEHKPLKLPADPAKYPSAVSEALKAIASSGISGPYALILGAEQYFKLIQVQTGAFPPFKIIEQMLEGEIIMSPHLKGAIVLSTGQGSFELTVGQDFSIGYSGSDHNKLNLFLTESFAFRTLEPLAAVSLDISKQ